MNVPLVEVQKEWREHRGLDQLKVAGFHFHLYQDVYGMVFRPEQFMRVQYREKEIHRGVIMTPSEVWGWS